MYDAWTAYDMKAVDSRRASSLRRPGHEHTLVNKERAVSVAAHSALVDAFPSERRLFDAAMEQLGYDPSDTSTDRTTPTGIGTLACEAVLSLRHMDGANQLGDLTGSAPYSDRA